MSSLHRPWLFVHQASILFLHSTLLAAPPALFPSQFIDVGLEPIYLSTHDFDADGHEDLAVANRGGGISILRGNGDGTFQAERRFDAGDAPFWLEVADIDDNGRDDLIVANFDSNEISILSGSGDGTFADPINLQVGGGPFSVAVGDLNGDAHPDLVTANFFSDDISVLLTSQNSVFLPATSYAVGSAPTVVVMADFDSDGHHDLAVANLFGGDISLLHNDGRGFFTSVGRIGDQLDAWAITAADFNEDGLVDLASASFSGHLSIFFGNGNGTFSSESRIPGRTLSQRILSEDIDLDGHVDLATANFSPGDISLFWGNGDGSFQPEKRFATGSNAVALSAGDFDRDGIKDLAVASPISNGVTLLFGEGSHSYGPESIKYDLTSNLSSLAAGDFQEDGNVDLVVAGRSSSYPGSSILGGNGDGTFRISNGGFFVFGPFWTSDVSVGDINGDGAEDIADVNVNFDANAPGNIAVSLNDGDGRFFPGTGISVGRNPSQIATGDLNEDGLADLAVASLVQRTPPISSLYILASNGDGTFVSTTLFGPSTGTPEELLVTDLNDDSHLDLLFLSRGGFSIGAPSFIRIALGNGSGGFSSTLTYLLTATNPTRVALGDLNNDGMVDLVISNVGMNNLTLMLGIGNGGFGPQMQLQTGSVSFGVAVGDLNADGRVDIAAGSGDRGDVVVLLGNGDATFSLLGRFGSGATVRNVLIADVDRDLRADLVVTYSTGVTILLNQGPFPNRPPVALASADSEVECTSPAGAHVTLDGSGSSDPDSTSDGTDILLFEWFEDSGLPSETSLGTGETLEVILPLGLHRITLQITDRFGAMSADEVRVVILDTLAPEVSAVAAPVMLWPPNHRMVPVAVAVVARDICDPAPLAGLASVTSSESDDAPGSGDGHTLDDIQGVQPGSTSTTVHLRAERAGSGGGRLYTIAYSATDGSGNRAVGEAGILVPHDQGGEAEPVEVAITQSPEGGTIQTSLIWTAALTGRSYNVLRGSVSRLSSVGSFTVVENAACLGRGLTGNDLSGGELDDEPPPGEAFFYLVEYFDGRFSGYGTATGRGEIVVASGDSCR